MATKTNGEILVNTTTAGSQAYESVTSLSGGGFVVVWQDDSMTGGDSSGSAIRGQVFNAAGVKTGGEFLVNTVTTGGQFAPSVDEIPGGFAVAWEDTSAVLGDAAGRGIAMQRFDLTGAKVGAETLVNTTTAGEQSAPALSNVGGVNYVVAWTDASNTGGDTAGSAIRAQVFGSDGTKTGGEILVNTTTAGFQGVVDVATKGPNGFVAVWQDTSHSADDTDGLAVRGQRFGFAGDKIGAEFLVNTTTPLNQYLPSVYSFSDASFIVLFKDAGGATDTIRAQRFTNLGVKSGAEIVIAGPDAGFKGGLDVVTLSNGGFVATWQDARTVGPDTSETSIWLQEYSSTNAKVGSELLVNTTTVGPQGNPHIDVLSDGRVVVTWEDFGATNGDTSDRAVRAQLFATDAVTGTGGTGGTGGTSTTPSAGSDSVTGTAGPDTVNALAGDDTVNGQGGADSISGGDGNDRINGGDGVQGSADGADTLSGGDGNDTVNGNVGNDVVTGDNGDDVLRGGRDDDSVSGGAGNDYVSGDLGSDTLSGGAGADTFHSFGGAGLDRVIDFVRAEGDRVLLDAGTVFTTTQVGADTVINMTGGGQMVLVGVSMASLTGDWITVG